MFYLINADAASSVRRVSSPSAMRKMTNNFNTVYVYYVLLFFL